MIENALLFDRLVEVLHSIILTLQTLELFHTSTIVPGTYVTKLLWVSIHVRFYGFFRITLYGVTVPVLHITAR